VFNEAESKKFADRLIFLFYIFKGIIGLNNQRIIEYLLSDPVHIDTFGILECIHSSMHPFLDDPDINISLSKYRYRAFLRERVAFVNTVNIQSPEILEKIRINFRLIFLRDTAAARWIEEATYELLMNV